MPGVRDSRRVRRFQATADSITQETVQRTLTSPLASRGLVRSAAVQMRWPCIRAGGPPELAAVGESTWRTAAPPSMAVA